MTAQKDVVQPRNPAGHHVRRVEESVASPYELESFSFSFGIALDILLQSHPCSPSAVGGFKRLLNNVLESKDLLGFVDSCSSFRSALTQTGDIERTDIKSVKGRWVRGLRIAISYAVPDNLIRHPSPSFNAVVTFLGWLKRLPVCIRPLAESVDEYFIGERRISSISFEENRYVGPLARIWKEWFRNFKLISPFRPKHGSGSTADVGRVRSHKWRSLSTDIVARVCLRYPNLERAIDLPCDTAKNRVSKVVFVPKQAGKDRAICMEPAWLQFLQQGVSSQLVAFTHRANHPLSNLVNIYSQDTNRYLCGHALMRGLATIDLTDASDSVSWRLVRILTKGLPLQRYLFGTRSTHTILDGRCVKVDKYAPMGSALCFPMECFIFASIVELAYRIHYGEASKGHHSGCSVYGDDIICPSEIYDLVVEILQSLGFRVNTNKSFSSGIYYESCGVEVLNHERIITVRHPRSHLLPRQEVVSPEQVGMVTDLANSLLSCGYTRARRTLLKKFRDVYIVLGKRKIPFFKLVEFSDRHCHPVTDPYHQVIFIKDYQCLGYNQLKVEPVSKHASQDLQEWRSLGIPRTRAQRISQRFSCVNTEVHERWSQKGVTMLSRFKFFDLVRNGDIEESGTVSTGRMHYKLRRRKRTL